MKVIMNTKSMWMWILSVAYVTFVLCGHILGHTTQTGCQSCCKTGRDGKNGRDGKDGLNGVNGVDGINGVDGRDGVNGKDGKDGKDSKGRNWKECAWDRINEENDNGVIKTCVFLKKATSTYLYVQVASNMRVAVCDNCCKRWYVTFDGVECAPVPLDGVVFMARGKTQNNHRPQVVAGHCKITKKGIVNVALNVGNCPGHGNANAYTGWNSATRIYIEEIEAPQ